MQSRGNLSLWTSSVSVFVACATSFCSSAFSVSKGPCSWPGNRAGGLWSTFSRSSQWLTELVSLNASELLRDLLKIFWPVEVFEEYSTNEGSKYKMCYAQVKFQRKYLNFTMTNRFWVLTCTLTIGLLSCRCRYVCKAIAPLILSYVHRDC